MSDANLRELERRWRELGSVEAEAAWLQARIRAGDLAPERLELAAFWGSSAARECLPGHERSLSSKEMAAIFDISSGTLGKWVRKGCPASKPGRGRVFHLVPALEWYETVLNAKSKAYQGSAEENFLQRASEWLVANSPLRASVAAARRVLSALESLPTGLGLATGALDAVELHLSCASEESRDLAISACKATEAWARALPPSLRRFSDRWPAPYAAALAAAVSSPDLPQHPAPQNFNSSVGTYVLDALSYVTGEDPNGECLLARRELRLVMAGELVPWALGYRDPVRERVAARQRGAGE